MLKGPFGEEIKGYQTPQARNVEVNNTSPDTEGQKPIYQCLLIECLIGDTRIAVLLRKHAERLYGEVVLVIRIRDHAGLV